MATACSNNCAAGVRRPALLLFYALITDLALVTKEAPRSWCLASDDLENVQRICQTIRRETPVAQAQLRCRKDMPLQLHTIQQDHGCSGDEGAYCSSMSATRVVKTFEVVVKVKGRRK